MKKVGLDVSEILVYNHRIIIEIPDEMEEEELEDALDRAQKGECLDDFMYSMKEYGIGISDVRDIDLSSPDRTEIECYYFEILDEEDE